MDEILNENGEPIVDWEIYMRARAQLGAGFARILSYFREDGDKSVARIEDAMHRQDAAALVLPAHTVKSEARQFGDEYISAEHLFLGILSVERSPGEALLRRYNVSKDRVLGALSEIRGNQRVIDAYLGGAEDAHFQ